jgi:hypothetical protein
VPTDSTDPIVEYSGIGHGMGNCEKLNPAKLAEALWNEVINTMEAIK